MKQALYIFILCVLFYATANAQTQKRTSHICMDIAHKEKFWHDPAAMEGLHPDFIARVKYMTNEIVKTLQSVDGELVYLKSEIKPEQLAKCNLLFIHIPTAKYTQPEVEAISNYVEKGGSLLMVMDEDYWSTLEQTNVNEILHPFGIQFEGANPACFRGWPFNPIIPNCHSRPIPKMD